MQLFKSQREDIFSTAAVFMAFILFFPAACATDGKIDNFFLNPAEGDQAVYTHEGLVITLRYLDESNRIQYLRASGREALARGISELPLSTFLLQVINKSGSEVVVDPARIRFVTGAGPMLGPVSYAHLYMALPRGVGRQAVLQELQGVVFDKPVTVSPGGRESGLVFFDRPEKVSRKVAVILDGLYLGGALLKAELVFEAVPVEE